MKVLRIVALWAALALTGALPVAGQSLAEAARKEKERQQAAQKQGKTVKTYTSEDLAKKKAEAGSTAGTAPTPAPAGASAPATTPAGPTDKGPAAGETPEQVEKKWVDRYKAIKMEIRQKRERIQALQNELNQLTTGLMGAWSPGQSQAIRDTIAARQEEIKKLEAEIRAKEAELDRVVREARREGVPPGAFRKADRELETPGASQKGE
jgi:DNA repair exonuclease SbcCD ATPase subunit